MKGLDLSNLFLNKTLYGISSKLWMILQALGGTGQFSLSVPKSGGITYFFVVIKRKYGFPRILNVVILYNFAITPI